MPLFLNYNPSLPATIPNESRRDTHQARYRGLSIWLPEISINCAHGIGSGYTQFLVAMHRKACRFLYATQMRYFARNCHAILHVYMLGLNNIRIYI